MNGTGLYLALAFMVASAASVLLMVWRLWALHHAWQRREQRTSVLTVLCKACHESLYEGSTRCTRCGGTDLSEASGALKGPP